MSIAPDYGMLLTAVPPGGAGAAIAKRLIDEKLAACVQLLPMESFYSWEGEIQHAAEVLLLVKTRIALFETAIARIKDIHPHAVPEIVGTGFLAGFSGYFDWIETVT